MSTYTINKTNGNTLVTVPEATINTSACPVALVGRRASNYGELMAENFVKLVENFAHNSSPATPMIGQLWFDTGTETLKIYNDAAWIDVVNVASGGSNVTANQLISTANTGTAPLIVNSTTKVTNLNADYLDGYSTDLAASALSVVVRDASGNITANVFNGIATSARYADLAERFAASEALEPGDVVEIGGSQEIMKATGPSCLGVVSTNPAIRMNEDAGSDETHPFVALAGRVPCKVSGQVRKGDRLVSAGNGTAMKGDASATAVIGRALEDKDGDAVSLVMIVVGVK